jgi:hypothetical protein
MPSRRAPCRTNNRRKVIVRIKIKHITTLLVATPAAIAIATAPSAWAAPNTQSCSDAGGATQCHTPGNAEIHAEPQSMPRIFHSSINPKYRQPLGYNPEWPFLGHHPYWQSFGYNPEWNGFHHQVWKPTSCNFSVAQCTFSTDKKGR